MNAYNLSLAITKALKEKWGYENPRPYNDDERRVWCLGGGNFLNYEYLDNIMPALRWIEEKDGNNMEAHHEGDVVFYLMGKLEGGKFFEYSGDGKTDREAAMNLLAKLCGVSLEGEMK